MVAQALLFPCDVKLQNVCLQKRYRVLLLGLGLLGQIAIAHSEVPCRIENGAPPVPDKFLSDIEEITHLSLIPTTSQSETQTGPLKICEEKIKKAITNRMPLMTSPIAEIQPEVSRLNSSIGSDAVSNISFLRTSTRTDQVDAVALKRHFKKSEAGGASEYVSVSYNLKFNSSGEGSSALSTNIETEIYERGKLIGTLAQVSSYDGQCEPHLQSQSYTKFKYSGDVVDLFRVSSFADGSVEKDKKTISKSLVDGKLRADQYDFSKRYPDHESFNAFLDFDITDIHHEINRVRTQDKVDPVSGQTTKLEVYRLVSSQGNEKFSDTVFALSPQTGYGMSKMTLSASPKVSYYEEVVSEDAWKRTEIITNEDPVLKSDTFTASELVSSSLPLTVDANQALEFDNMAAYGTWVHAPAFYNSYHYNFNSELRSPTPPLKPIDGPRYTQETAFYDFKSPEVAEIVASIRQRNLSSSQAQVEAILETLGKTVRYDSEMVNNDTVRPMKASAVINEKKGVCQNFAALFVAISRGLGIPARTIQGIALIKGDVKTNSFQASHHAWAEVSLDGKTWTPVEPQVSKTIGLPFRGYVPFNEMDVYERQKGPDMLVNGMIQNAGLKLQIRHGQNIAQ
jgi:transglutaminase-like putative cysteine protease